MSASVRTGRTNDVCLTVLEAVADCHDIDVLDIDEPLQYTVDGDALSRLWGPTAVADGVGELTFEYYGCRVTVTSDGSVDAELR